MRCSSFVGRTIAARAALLLSVSVGAAMWSPLPSAAQISIGGGGVSVGGLGGVSIGGGGIGMGLGGPGGVGVGIGAGGTGISLGGSSIGIGPGGFGGGLGAPLGGLGGLNAGVGGLGYGVGGIGRNGQLLNSRGIGFGGANLNVRDLTARGGALATERADLGLNLGPTLKILDAPGRGLPRGLHIGDVVQAIDGVNVTSPQDVARFLANRSPNEDVLLSVVHDGIVHDVLVRLNSVLQTPPLSGRPEGLVEPALGLDARPLHALLGVTLGRGLEITGVDPTGAAAAAGLKVGDILLGADGFAITSDDALARALADLRTGSVNVTALRDGRPFDVFVGPSLENTEGIVGQAAAAGGTGIDNALVGDAGAGTGVGLGTVIGKFPGTNDPAAALGTGGGLGVTDEGSPIGDAAAGSGVGAGALLGAMTADGAKNASALGAGGGLGAALANTPVGNAAAGGGIGAGLLQSNLKTLAQPDGFTVLGTGGGVGAALDNELGKLDTGAGIGLGGLLGNLPSATRPGGFLALGTGGGGGAIDRDTPIGDAGVGGGAGLGAMVLGIGTPGGNAGGLTGIGTGGGLGAMLNNTPVGDVDAGTGIGLGVLLAGKNFQGTPLNPAVGLGEGIGVGLNNSPLGNVNVRTGAGVGVLVGGVTQGSFPNGTVVNAGGGAAITAENTPIGSAAVEPTPGAEVAIGQGDNPGNVAAGGGGSGYGGGTHGGKPNTDGATTLGGGGNYGGGGVVIPGGSGNTGNGDSTFVGGGGGNAVNQGSGGINVPGGSGTGSGDGETNPGTTGGNTLIGGQGGSDANNGAGGIRIPGPNNGTGGGTSPADNGGNTLVGGQGGNDAGNGAGGIVLPGSNPGTTPGNNSGNTVIGGEGGNPAGSGSGGIVIPGGNNNGGPPTIIGGGGGTPSGDGSGGIVVPGVTSNPPGGGDDGTPTTPGNNGGSGGSFGSSGGSFGPAGGNGGGYAYPAFYSPQLGLYGEQGAAYLGVMFENDELIVAHVCHHGPAEAAGVRRFDRLVAIDQQTFADHAAFVAYMQTVAPLELVQLTVMRDEEPVNLVVELGGLLPPDAEYGVDIDGILAESIADYSDDDLHAQEDLGFLVGDEMKILHACPTDAAFLAGVRRDDVLRSINEQKFDDREALTKFVASLKPGDVLNVVVRRGDRDEIVSWKFGEANVDAQAVQKLASNKPLVVFDDELRVARVDRESEAYAAGLRTGDVVTYFNGRPLESLDQTARALRETPPGEQVHFVAERNGRSKSVLWKLNDVERR